MNRIVVLSLFLCILAISCKKSNNEEGGGESRKIADVIPAAYLKTVTDNGMEIHEGTNPPTVNGTYNFGQWRFDYDNFSPEGAGTPIGYKTAGFKVTFSEQQANQNINVNLTNYLSQYDLESTFITGNGNNFTIFFKSNVVGGMSALFSYPYAFLISGKVEGNTLRNIKMAHIGMGKALTTQTDELTVAGEVALYSDDDGISEKE